jgi:hypothetical protein
MIIRGVLFDGKADFFVDDVRKEVINILTRGEAEIR